MAEYLKKILSDFIPDLILTQEARYPSAEDSNLRQDYSSPKVEI